MKRLTLCFLFFTVLTTGCELSTQSTTATEGEMTNEAFVPTATFIRFYSMPNSRDLQEKYTPDFQSPEVARQNRKALMRAHLEALREIGDLIEPRRVLNEQEIGTIHRFLDDHQNEEYHFLLEQSVAFYLSEPILLRKIGDGQMALVEISDKSFAENELKALSFATRLLIENNNPTADLIATSLQALTGYWPEEDIQNSAKQSRVDADTWLNEVNKYPSKSPMEATTHRYQAIRDALATLERLSS